MSPLCRSRITCAVVEQALRTAHTFYHLMGLLTRRLLKSGDKPDLAYQQLVDAAVNELTNAVYRAFVCGKTDWDGYG